MADGKKTKKWTTILGLISSVFSKLGLAGLIGNKTANTVSTISDVTSVVINEVKDEESK